MRAGDVTAVLSIVLGLGTIAGAVMAVGWNRASKERTAKLEAERTAQMATINTQVQTLVAVNEEVRNQRHQDRLDFERELAQERKQCATEIAHLKGRLEVLTGEFVRDLVTAVAAAIRNNPEQETS